jgi:hypothetical protein
MQELGHFTEKRKNYIHGKKKELLTLSKKIQNPKELCKRYKKGICRRNAHSSISQ